VGQEVHFTPLPPALTWLVALHSAQPVGALLDSPWPAGQDLGPGCVQVGGVHVDDGAMG